MLTLVLTAALLVSHQVEASEDEPACRETEFEGSGFTVCTYDADRDSLSLIWADWDGEALRSLSALPEVTGEGNVRFAMNAGMFNAHGRAIGLYVEDSAELVAINRRPGPGNFHMLPNGVFWLDADGNAHVTATPDFTSDTAAPVWATQSGPMLVIDGVLHPRFSPDGTSRYIRNGVGTGDDGDAFFVISEEVVSFGKFARFFRDELGSRNALYLDGGVSSLWDPASGRMDYRGPIGPMVVVRRTSTDEPG